jgi:hypothetical protein
LQPPSTPAKPTFTHISLSKVGSEELTFAAKPSLEDKSEHQVEMQISRPRRASIESLIPINTLPTLDNLDVNPEMFRSISDYILSERPKFSPLPITKETFVRFRNEDVNLSYVFGEKLGEGSYGIVFRAICRRTGAVRAAKLLKRSRLPEEELRKVECEV